MAPSPPQQTTPEQRLALSLRLKAARYLGGRQAEDGRAVAITVAELANHQTLRTNGITKNRIEDYEQMKVLDPRPMELEKIAEALGVPPSFILGPLKVNQAVETEPAKLFRMLEELQREVQQWSERMGRDQIGRDELDRRKRRDARAKDHPAEPGEAAA